VKDPQIEAVFNPRSLALIGASSEEAKLGYTFARNLTSGYQGRLYFVNPKGGDILGHRAYASINDLPEPIDLAVIVIPAKAVPDAMKELAQKGTKAAVVITAGFGEAGPEGKKLEEEMMKEARKGNIKVIGPNCFGVYNCNIRLNASMGLGMPEGGGDISFLTQSGAYGMAIFTFAMDHSMKFAKVMAHGNKAGIDDYEVIRYFGEDEETKVICLFLESVDKGRKFYEEAKKIALTKPIVATKTGRTAGAKRAAASHTAALAGTFTAYDAAFKQSGIVFARNGMDLISIAKGLDWQPIPLGKRVGIVTNSGGTGVELADLCEESGLVVPEFQEKTQKRIRALIPPYASARNPVDMTPVWPQYEKLYSEIVRIMYESDDVDIIIPVFLHRSALMPEVCVAVAETVNECLAKGMKKPTYACWVSTRDALQNMDLLQKKRVPCFDWPERTARAVAGIVGYADFLRSRSVDLEGR